ncbi:MAG: acyltransferase family protein [Panacagrimonas sp.]
MYKSLHAARALAALPVLLFHLNGTMGLEKYFGIQVFPIPYSFSYQSVVFFFVLSGFIIHAAHKRDISQPHRLGSYFRKRLARVFPTYWIILVSIFLICLALPAWRDNVPHDAYTLLKTLALVPQDKEVVGGTGAPILAVAWTLQFEMVFYVFFAIMILNKWLASLVGLALLSLCLTFTEGSTRPFPWSFLSQDYILLFGMGMAVSAICASRKPITDKPWLFILAGTLPLALICFRDWIDMRLLAGWETIWGGLACSVLVFGLVQAEDRGLRVFDGKWLQLLGDSTYALYLIHFPLLSFLCKLLVVFGAARFGVAGTVISFVAIFFGCIVASILFHIWIERPLVAYFRNAPPRPTPGALAQSPKT